MSKQIAVLAGDGIGPEVMDEALKVLVAISKISGVNFNYTHALIGAAAIDGTGSPFPKATEDVCKKADAILFGAIGHPKYDNDPKAKVRPEQGLLAMRKSLGLFANIRPVNTYEALAEASPLKSHLVKGVDFIVFRELTGGIYFGQPRGRSEDGFSAYDTCTYTAEEIRRVAVLAFEEARKRKKQLTLVDKANVLATSRLWREVVKEMAATDYADIEVDYLFVDNAAMKIITNPAGFDVVLTENMFGDILTDEASVITGSLGMLPSASVGASVALFEPIHGSYPQATGKGIANPMAMILSAATMLDMSFGMMKEAAAIRLAVNKALNEGYVTEDINPSNSKSTSQVGDYVVKIIEEQYSK